MPKFLLQKQAPPVDVYGPWAPMPREDFSLVAKDNDCPVAPP